MAQKIEEKVVFGLSPAAAPGQPLDLMLGVPAGAWEYMKDGKTHTFDLTQIGLPIRIVMYGAEDHTAAMKHIEEHNKRLGVATLDERRRDFSIKPK